MTAPASPLLDAGFLRELELLRRRLVVRARSGAAGDRGSKRRGGSAEFTDHRPYAPGDDLRRIDWAAYARSGEPVVKLFRAEEDLVARVVLDASASLLVPEAPPTKLDVARRIAAAIGYMTLAGSERAQLFVAGEGIERTVAPVRGKAGVAGWLRSLGTVEAKGGTDLSRAVDAIIRQSARPGLCAVVSDFFDGGPVITSLARAAQGGHDVVLVQVVAPEEIDPRFEGDFALEDAETGAVVDVTMDAAAVEAYVRRFEGLCAELRAFAKKHRATYVRVRTDEPLEGAVRRVVARSID